MKPSHDILPQIRAFAQAEGILLKGDQILLAVSGGLDSVAMLHLLASGQFRLGVAHCNFALRGAEADADEALVKQLAEQYKLPFYSTRFDTQAYATTHGLSIQMAARELRYNWLNEVRKANGFHFIATAHHRNDQAETLLLNLTRGTGISGLRGMLPKAGYIIRPVLSCSRAQLEAYALAHQLQWREDASNREDKYQRNLLRNQVLPLLAGINPAVVDTLGTTADRFRDTELIYQAGLKALAAKLVEYRKGDLYIPIRKLLAYPAYRTILWEILQPFGFNATQVEAVLPACRTGRSSTSDTETKTQLADNHRLIKDRQFIIVTSLLQPTHQLTVIDKLNKNTKLGPLELKYHTKPGKNYHLKDQADTVALDLDQLPLPLTLRTWQAGDYFYPLGLGKKKKVNRYLIDQKLNQLQKEQTYVLCTGDRIAWLVGLRLDERFKVTETTQRVLEIRWKRN